MLYHLFEYLDKYYDIPGAGVFHYISFRAGAAIILSLILTMVFGGRIIRHLRKLQVGESVRDLGLEGQKGKEGTPTMGGIIILIAILVPVLLLADLNNVYILLMIIATTWMAVIGFIDDYIKVFQKNKQGLKAIFKVLGQVALGLLISMTMLFNDEIVVRFDQENAELANYRIVKTVDVPIKDQVDAFKEYAYVKAYITNLPFVKENALDYAWLTRVFGDIDGSYVWIIFVPLVIFIVTAVSNAANLTDGLDGLATGVSAIIGVPLGILAYVSGNVIAADYLKIFYLPGTSELVIFSACFIGACVGFLWHNTYPAQVFMGDTGSLMLGGIIAALAILIRKELLIPILCGVFLVENLSVVLQVSYFKYTKKKYGEGRRIFKMSPLHHHYQKSGMPEPRIVVRFWIITILLAVFTIITLKIR